MKAMPWGEREQCQRGASSTSTGIEFFEKSQKERDPPTTQDSLGRSVVFS
jgi:hypothetical protein